MEKKKLLKLLRLTKSDNDNEALCAIRKANLMLDQNRASWDAIIYVSTEKQEQPQHPARRLEKFVTMMEFALLNSKPLEPHVKLAALAALKAAKQRHEIDESWYKQAEHFFNAMKARRFSFTESGPVDSSFCIFKL